MRQFEGLHPKQETLQQTIQVLDPTVAPGPTEENKDQLHGIYDMYPNRKKVVTYSPVDYASRLPVRRNQDKYLSKSYSIQ